MTEPEFSELHRRAKRVADIMGKEEMPYDRVLVTLRGENEEQEEVGLWDLSHAGTSVSVICLDEYGEFVKIESSRVKAFRLQRLLGRPPRIRYYGREIRVRSLATASLANHGLSALLESVSKRRGVSYRM